MVGAAWPPLFSWQVRMVQGILSGMKWMVSVNSLQMLLLSLVLLASQAVAGELDGTVLHSAGEYLYLHSVGGRVVARTDGATAYGNMPGIGALKYGGEPVRVTYGSTLAGVLIADSVSRETGYLPSAEQNIPVEQFATDIANNSALAVDCRSRKEWDSGRIPGAVLYSNPADLLKIIRGKQKGTQVVFYGSSPSDVRPYEAARASTADELIGFRIFPGGIHEWRRQKKPVYASPVHLERLLQSGGAFRVIDLRDPVQGQVKLVDGAEQIPVASISRQRIFLPERPFQFPLFLFGNEQSYPEAANRLAALGYYQEGEITFLDESWKEWPGKFDLKGYRPGDLPAGEIGYEEFRRLWNDPGPGKVILNVKPGRDRETPWELHIPLGHLPERINELPKDKEIIVYCSAGLRSAIAHAILENNGFTSRFLGRGFLLDVDKKPEPDSTP